MRSTAMLLHDDIRGQRTTSSSARPACGKCESDLPAKNRPRTAPHRRKARDRASRARRPHKRQWYRSVSSCAFRARITKTPACETFGSAFARHVRSGKADVREPGGVLVPVERNILPLPIGERRAGLGKYEIEYATDHERMGMALDDILDLAVDRRQRSLEQRHAGS